MNSRKTQNIKFLVVILALFYLSCTGGSSDIEKTIEHGYAATIDATVDYQEIFERRDVTQTIEYVSVTSPLPVPSPIPLVDFSLAANAVSVEDNTIHVSKKNFSGESIADEGGEISIGLPAGAFFVYFTGNYKGVEIVLGYLSFIKSGGMFYSSLIETEADEEIEGAYLKNIETMKKLSGNINIGKLKFDEDKGIVYPEKKSNDPYCSIDSDADGISDCDDPDANGNGVLDNEEFEVPAINFDKEEYIVSAGENLLITGEILNASDISFQTSPADLDFISINILDDEIEIEISPEEDDIGTYEITITAANSNGTVVKIIKVTIM